MSRLVRLERVQHGIFEVVPIAQLQPKEYVQRIAPGSEHYTEAEALAYTRWLATHHYENFQVVSLFLPKRLHQDFYNIYAFCRWADDLGDEIDDPAESLRLLGWWRQELTAMYRGEHAVHPVFVALKGTVERFEIPIEPFARLISAFEQDQTTTRYQTFEDLFGYCTNSANPVGHLVLYLGGYSDKERQHLSDCTCTGLQLANFWQDVTVDLKKDRVYLPLDLLKKYSYTVADLFALKYDRRFEQLMGEAVNVALDFFRRGLPLIAMVDRRLAFDLELFSKGGMKVLHKIWIEDYNVLKRRPSISKAERVGMLIQCLPRLLRF